MTNTPPRTNNPKDWDILAERADSKRFPRIPTRAEIPVEELLAWDEFQVRFEKVRTDKYALEYRHRIAGGFFGLMCSPRLAAQLTHGGKPAMAQQGKPGSFTAADHEFIDLVLSFDSGHWGLLANHVPFAVASGIPTSTVRALRDKRESELSEADRQVVAFIRATRDGTITNEMWAAMVKRIGSERGVVELMYFTLHLLMHVRLIQAFDEVQILPHELEDLLQKLERGEYPLPAVSHAGPPETKPIPAHPYKG
jgi:hypothetical protein